MKSKPRCVLITNGNLASMIALADWIAKHGDCLVKVYVTYRLPSSKGNVRGVWAMLRRSGWRYTWLKIWINRAAPMCLRLAGKPASVADLLARYSCQVDVNEVDSVNSHSIINEIKEAKVDIIVSFSATQRFSDALLALPALGAINVHYGALPAYAGLSPYYWHLHNHEAQYGVTLHRIESKLDAGSILRQVIAPIGSVNTCLALLLRMAGNVSPLLNDFFDGGCVFTAAREQDLSNRTYFGHPTRSDVRMFMKNGFRMMNRSARTELYRRVREVMRSGGVFSK